MRDLLDNPQRSVREASVASGAQDEAPDYSWDKISTSGENRDFGSCYRLRPTRESRMDQTPLVAIVDDDPSVRKALGRLCRSNGYRVQLYDSSESFLDARVVEETDFLILDLHLPGKSGLELQAELSAMERDCPILFITALDDDAARQQAIEKGAVDFLIKPPDVDKMLTLIEKALSRAS